MKRDPELVTNSNYPRRQHADGNRKGQDVTQLHLKAQLTEKTRKNDNYNYQPNTGNQITHTTNSKDEDLPELEQNWTEKRIQSNLPKSNKLTVLPTKHKTLKPEELKLQIYRNAREQTPLINTLDKIFLENALNPKDLSTGLKFIILQQKTLICSYDTCPA